MAMSRARLTPELTPLNGAATTSCTSPRSQKLLPCTTLFRASLSFESVRATKQKKHVFAYRYSIWKKHFRTLNAKRECLGDQSPTLFCRPHARAEWTTPSLLNPISRCHLQPQWAAR